MELALSNIYLETRFPQLLQDTFDIDFMLSFYFTINKDVIQVRSVKVVEIFTESIVNIVLERGGPIIQAKGYNEVLEQSKSSAEGY